MAIILLFHLPGCRFFKRYYYRYACARMRDCFPASVSYSRFVELMNLTLLPLLLYAQRFRQGRRTGISFILNFLESVP
jgi:hypothetical protein